jgi:hypothetical protein
MRERIHGGLGKAEAFGGFLGREPLEHIGPQCLILALVGGVGGEKESLPVVGHLGPSRYVSFGPKMSWLRYSSFSEARS